MWLHECTCCSACGIELNTSDFTCQKSLVIFKALQLAADFQYVCWHLPAVSTAPLGNRLSAVSERLGFLQLLPS